MSSPEVSDSGVMTPFASAVLAWFENHGRHDLPWQHPRTPYRVLVSEVMLQQTQVATVTGYFDAFMERFPDVATLAAAPEDDLMAAWAGLGYYRRARNLHAAAKQCMAQHAGEIPSELDALMALPGVGRSTAGAIRAQAFDLPAPILDANVKRVLSRYALIRGWSGKADVLKALWGVALQHTPNSRCQQYTQAMMDLGSLVCTARGPRCQECPVRSGCAAHAQGCVSEVPESKPRRTLPLRHCFVLLSVDDAGRVLLEKRPPTGIWAGLYSLPESDQAPPGTRASATPVKHAFSHYRLTMTPLRVDTPMGVEERDTLLIGRADLERVGLPKPIRRLLDNFFDGKISWQERLSV